MIIEKTLQYQQDLAVGVHFQTFNSNNVPILPYGSHSWKSISSANRCQKAFKVAALEKITSINLKQFINMPKFLRVHQPFLLPVLALKNIFMKDHENILRLT